MTAVVGESGSGKSLVALSVLGIQPPAFERIAGRMLFRGVDLFGLDEKAMRRVRGAEISMVFQDARAALNPVFTVGRQLADVWQLQHGGSRRAAMKQAIEALARVSIPEPERRARQYPHEFSGGMAQRAMIAMAVADLPAVAADPRRADDRARRHHPVRHHGADRRAQPHARAHDLPDHPRSRRRRRDLPGGRGDECRPRGRDRQRRGDLHPAAATATPSACCRRASWSRRR